MAKGKKSRGTNVEATPTSSGSCHWDVGIRSAENGAIVNISHESGGKERRHESKTLVASSPRAAFRVAAAHLPALAKKVAKGKKPARKKVLMKKA